MRIIFFTDGADDGLAAARNITRLIEPSVVTHATLVAVTWPERSSPTWDRAHDLQLFAHGDLHDAMALAADQAVKQLRSFFATDGVLIDENVMIGDPAEQIIALIGNVKPDAVFIRVTSRRHHDAVFAWVVEVTKGARCTIAVIHCVVPTPDESPHPAP